jgi:heat shock protein HslJ
MIFPRLLCCIFALVLAACSMPGREQTDTPSVPQPAHTPAGPTPAPSRGQLAGALVSGIEEPGFDADSAVWLADGQWQGEPFAPGAAVRPRLMLLPNLMQSADLDGDGSGETIALLSASSGGSGERIHIAVFGTTIAGTVSGRATLVGDRVKLRALMLAGNQVVLDVVEVGRWEPACCGTQLARLRYRLENGVLQQTAHEVEGSLSLAVLDGSEWTLIELDGRALEANAPTLQIAGDRAAGFSGCNRYAAQLKSEEPGSIRLVRESMLSTLMACAPPQSDIEAAFLAAIGRVSHYTFLDGQLALSWHRQEGSGTLLFRRVR